MKLLDVALRKDDFGLRTKFPWSSAEVKFDFLCTNINDGERKYLTTLLQPVFPSKVLTIKRIENPYLWGSYVLRYEEMKSESESEHVQEQIMIHATAASLAHKIAEENFNWRLVRRDRFGTGISFTSDPKYAAWHATRTNVYIIAGVLVANSSPGYWGQKIPEAGYDTTTGFTKDVCIKYYDNDFYPYYIVE